LPTQCQTWTGFKPCESGAMACPSRTRCRPASSRSGKRPRWRRPHIPSPRPQVRRTRETILESILRVQRSSFPLVPRDVQTFRLHRGEGDGAGDRKIAQRSLQQAELLRRAKTSRSDSADSLGPALAANSLYRWQGKRTMRETGPQIGNSG